MRLRCGYKELWCFQKEKEIPDTYISIKRRCVCIITNNHYRERSERMDLVFNFVTLVVLFQEVKLFE